MKSKRSIIHYSVFATLIGLAPTLAYSAMRVGNNSRSYAAAYQQVNAMRNQTATTPGTNVATQQPLVVTPSTDVENNLPVRVADADLAQEISASSTDSAAYDRLARCAMIYPNGEFAWDAPTVGAGVGGADTCVAVVELRGYQAGPNGTDLVLARANLAAGDSIKCNISSFPESTMIASAVESFTFPADNAPTMDDVIAQMNQEQKKNAGLKIAAGVIIGGLGGNMSGANDPGNSSLLGTDQGKIQNTVIGALSGGALMAGNAYAGKVAGDTILSVGVNAAAGGVVGNMAASGDSVLRIEKCTIDGRDTTCLWGALVTPKPLDADQTAYYNVTTRETYVCDPTDGCTDQELVSVKLTAFPGRDIEDIDTAELENKVNEDISLRYYMSNQNGKMVIIPDGEQTDNIVSGTGVFTPIESGAGTIDRQIAAMVEMDDRAFGLSSEDWYEWKSSRSAGKTIYGRSGNGTAYTLPDDLQDDFDNFYPMKESATDGGLIDFGNKARLKGTLIGAGVGGALGGLSGYQGAQLDVQNRWTAASREYTDSLTTVYCITGDRYLSKYNDTVAIPAMSVVPEQE